MGKNNAKVGFKTKIDILEAFFNNRNVHHFQLLIIILKIKLLPFQPVVN